jgi:hypothetical protein
MFVPYYFYCLVGILGKKLLKINKKFKKNDKIKGTH